jgi:cytochrome P450
MILQAQDDNGEALSDEQILAHVNILLVAGHETTTTLSAWTLYLLATLPAQRRRLEAELDAVVGHALGPIEMETLRRLSHLDNFIKEVGRLYPPTLTVPRGVIQPVEFGGYRLPVGTPVRLGLAASHLLPQVFTEPHCFDPDRFASPRDEDRRTPYGLVTFGGGVRTCIGLNFALAETKTLVVHVLRHYELCAVTDQPIVHAGHLTAMLADDLRLQVKVKG